MHLLVHLYQSQLRLHLHASALLLCAYRRGIGRPGLCGKTWKKNMMQKTDRLASLESNWIWWGQYDKELCFSTLCPYVSMFCLHSFSMFSAFQAIRAKEALTADSSLSELKAGLQVSELQRCVGCFVFRTRNQLGGMAAAKVPIGFPNKSYEIRQI